MFHFPNSEEVLPAMTASDLGDTIGMYIDVVGEMKLADQLLVLSQILI